MPFLNLLYFYFIISISDLSYTLLSLKSCNLELLAISLIFT